MAFNPRREDDDDLLIDRSRPKTTDVKKTKSKKPKARDARNAESEGSDLQLQRPSKKEMKAKMEKDAPKPKSKDVKPPDSDAYFGFRFDFKSLSIPETWEVISHQMNFTFNNLTSIWLDLGGVNVAVSFWGSTVTVESLVG